VSIAPLAAVLALVVACTFWLATAWGDSSAATPAGTSTRSGSSTTQPTATSTAVATSSASSAPAATLTPVATTTAPTTLSLSLSDLGVSGAVSVAVYDIDDGEQLTAGAGSFETASIVKVDILVSLLVQRNGSLTTAQKTLARSMITVSDNSAATTLFQTVGSTTGLNRTNQALGLVETSAGTSGNWGLTHTTAADQLRLLKLIFLPNSVLSDASRTYVSSLMSAVSEDQDWGVTAAADDAGDSAVKDGWLQRTTTGLWDVTSIGRVEATGHRLLVVVLVTSASSMNGGVSTIERAASAAVKRVVAA
jgi:beta-lactamase class A